MILRAILASIVMLFSIQAAAMVPVMAYDYYASTELINPATQELDLSTLSMLARMSDPYRFNMADYVPLKGLADSDSGDRVARRIIQHTMQNLLDGRQDRNAGVLASAQKLNNNMKSSVGDEKNSIQFRVRPVEARAEISYKGELPVESSVSYVAVQNEIRFEVSRKIAETTVAYSHVTATDQQKDLVGVRWNF